MRRIVMNDFKVSIGKINQSLLDDYSKISIKFWVDSLYQLIPIRHGLGGVRLTEVEVKPYEKDYDSIESNPRHLLSKFNLANWRIVYVTEDGKMIAGAIIAYSTDGINMLKGKSDLAVLWDIRVNSDYRRLGLGSRIIDEVKRWAISRGFTRLKIETQNNNVKACNFYASQGATLTGYNMHYYNDYPEEVQFIWSINL